jgi:hypothetical protein
MAKNTSNLITAILLILLVVAVGVYTYHNKTSGFKNSLNYDFDNLAFNYNSSSVYTDENGTLNIKANAPLEFLNLDFNNNLENKAFNNSDITGDFKLTLEVETEPLTSPDWFKLYASFNKDANFSQTSGFDLNGFEINLAYDGNNLGYFGNEMFYRNLVIGNKLKITFTGNVEDDYILLQLSDENGLNEISSAVLSNEFANNSLSFNNFGFAVINETEGINASLKINSLKLEYN